MDPLDRSPRVLLVEDDAPLAKLVCTALSRAGYEVVTEPRGDRVGRRVRELEPDLIILDLMLPGSDGFAVCRELRPAFTGPILMMTALGEEEDQVAGLRIGADDYVVKPVRPRLLLARVEALLRRARGRAGARVVGEVEIVPSAREARVRGAVVPLAGADYELLAYLVRAAGRVVDRSELYRELRGIRYDGLDRAIDHRVARVRAALRPLLVGSMPIRTVHGRGYLFAVDE